MGKERLLLGQEQIERPVERVVLHRSGVHAQQVAQRRRAKPMPVEPPLASRAEQPVNRQDPHHLSPVRALPGHHQSFSKEAVQPQPPPQLVRQPARAPLPRMLQAHPAQAHLQGVHTAGRWPSVRREQRHLPRLPVALVNDFYRPLPRRSLAVVNFPKVKHVPVRHLAAPIPAALHDRPAAVRLTVLPALTTFQEHATQFIRSARLAEGGRSGLHALLENPICAGQLLASTIPLKIIISRLQ